MVLPLLGGAPAVWITAMLFFQTFLLLGYFYANVLAQFFKPKVQFIIHTALLTLFIISLPPLIPDHASPPFSSNPAFWQLSLMAVSLGGPFFIISATAPLLQNWYRFSKQTDSSDPYFLYSASNIGSLSALLLYPFLIEPLLSTQSQTYIWSAGYITLILLILLIFIRTKEHFSSVSDQTIRKELKPFSFEFKKEYLGWIFLSFIPASLLLGVTNYITTDIASVPLLWLLPMTLYLLTFIIAFSKTKFRYLKFIYPLQIFFLYFAVIFFLWTEKYTFFVLIIHILLFFITALITHTSLIKTKPPAENLTLFYLFISIGGALAGIFNALIAPLVFIQPLEYPLILGLAMFTRYWTDQDNNFFHFKNDLINLVQKKERGTTSDPLIILCAVIVSLSIVNVILSTATIKLILAVLIFFLFINVNNKRWLLSLTTLCVLLTNPGFNWFDNQITKKIERNYFGVIKVLDQPATNVRILQHGTTYHGVQSLDPELKLTPNAYYHEKGVFGEVFTYLDSVDQEQRIGVIGLGVGTLTCFSKKGRHYDFYEIDPDIIEIAEDSSLFSYLSDCGSPYNIIEGDGRLGLTTADNDLYDVIILDAFSSDNIPVHLLTIEAIRLYLSKLKPDGVLVFHISNRHLDIAPIISKHAENLDMLSLGKTSPTAIDKNQNLIMTAATIHLIFTEESAYKYFRDNNWKKVPHTHIRTGWTDDFSNILSILKLKKEANLYQKPPQTERIR
jgi:spermidine synthase